MQLRLRKWLADGGCVSRISTHVLDTALGRPAAGMVVHLEYAGPSGEWEKLGAQRDRRRWPLRQPFAPEWRWLCSPDNTGCASRPGPITRRRWSRGLYLTVEIIVTVRPGDTHLHVPLLLSPNGYTTYRGS